ncbi:WXG100 family type VII secretion target [Lentzea sp. NPDC059081]|uniref:WXG100 family type VII secretion target n=1 Tax=Lentzea sp. NPDC059081 TaxID=3346719 RepID=UPI00369B0560
MLTAAACLDETHHFVVRSMTMVGNAFATLKTTWTGEASDAFDSAMNDWIADCAFIAMKLGEMADIMNGNRQAIETGEQNNIAHACSLPTGQGLAGMESGVRVSKMAPLGGQTTSPDQLESGVRVTKMAPVNGVQQGQSVPHFTSQHPQQGQSGGQSVPHFTSQHPQQGEWGTGIRVPSEMAPVDGVQPGQHFVMRPPPPAEWDDKSYVAPVGGVEDNQYCDTELPSTEPEQVPTRIPLSEAVERAQMPFAPAGGTETG